MAATLRQAAKSAKEFGFEIPGVEKHVDEQVRVPPDGLEHVIEAFLNMHEGRRHSANGALRLTWSDIDAWCRLRRVELRQWQLDAVMILDQELITALYSKNG